MFLRIVQEQVSDFRVECQVRLQMRDDESSQQVRIVERVVRGLVCQGLGRESLHRIGEEIPVESVSVGCRESLGAKLT